MDKYDHMSKMQKQLLSRGIIDLVGDIDSDMAFYVREALMRLAIEGSPPITVQITSAGGNYGAGFGIYDLLTNYQGRVTGIILGFANSMASVILQACDIRLALRHSKIVVHYTLQNQVTRKQRKNQRENQKINKVSDVCDRNIIEIYAVRTGKSRRLISRLMDQETEFSAQEALAVGLIDGITKPKKTQKKKGDS